MNFLRRRAPEALPLALPLAIAVLIHALLIGLGSWRGRGAEASPPEPAVIDNTPQLVRLSRRINRKEPLVAASVLSLSATLPPPPPELLKTTEQPEAKDDCGGRAANGKAANSKAASSKAANGQAVIARSTPAVATAFEGPESLSPETISRLWGEAVPVPVWPEVFGPVPEGAQIRRLPLKALGGRSAKQLHKLTMTSLSAQFQLRADDQGVWIARQTLN
ncbi:hypothetical protein [Synechococcus sp. BS56D]|uniref:hypothetical protein n=1 Tax=Synechococcus sp. BS56D TaxID=2055944 RepID=UPI001038ED78|nr:hypothetical protein [Synechococcus sp. BS56D]